MHSFFTRIFSYLALRTRKGKGRVYLDYASATPVAPEVLRAMAPYFYLSYGNPGAIHIEGRAAKTAVESARIRIARTLRVRPEEIFFTSGGTEANNIGIIGVIECAHQEGRAYTDMEILSLPTEHTSVLETLRAQEARGVKVGTIPIDAEGLVDMEAFGQMLSQRTILVVMAYANSETGVVQDVKKISRTIRAYQKREGGALPYFLLDASQAPLYLPCALDSLGVDMMTLDAGKCYGPKGVGVLVKRADVALVPHTYGGDQERGLRPGTENVPLIVGCAEALVRAQESVEQRRERVMALREYFFTQLAEHLSSAIVNGSRTERIANNVNISIPGLDGEYAVVTLDSQGISASTRSACAGASGSGSHVVMSMTGDRARAESTIRFTLGESTTEREADTAIAVLVAHTYMMEGHRARSRQN